MNGSRTQRLVAMLLAGVGGVALASLAAVAFGKSFTLTVAKNVSVHGRRENVVANSSGVTVYELLPETTRHLLCTGFCLQVWPPVTVGAHAKLTKASGVKGTIAKFHRGSSYQVTLNGHPLYRYSVDNNKRGAANGDGVSGPNGSTWHVIRASTKTSSSPPPTTTKGITPPKLCLYPPYC